ncbi:hypothetical protein [Fretibacter rubidus]|uniref:hypothetical protein n=1 Tax=Fretibacter rubidus TaxID=570162 RepID=UPI00352B8B95
MDLNAPLYRDDMAPRYGAVNHGVYGVLARIFLWLRAVLGQEVRPHASAQNYDVYTLNRERRHRQVRFFTRAVPPARNHGPFHKFGPRGVSPTQFLERLCRLSVDGRITVYRMVYWSSRMTREAFMAILIFGEFRKAAGLWDAHIPPD